MKDRVQIGTHLIDGQMEGKLAGRFMDALAGPVGTDADNILAGERSLVDSGRSDPDVSFRIPDGKIAAGHGSHALVVDTLHEHDKLVSRMNVLNIHTDFRLSF